MIDSIDSEMISDGNQTARGAPARAHHTLHGCTLFRFLRTDRLVDEYQFKRFVSFSYANRFLSFRFVQFSFRLVSFRDHPVSAFRFVLNAYLPRRASQFESVLPQARLSVIRDFLPLTYVYAWVSVTDHMYVYVSE